MKSYILLYACLHASICISAQEKPIHSEEQIKKAIELMDAGKAADAIPMLHIIPAGDSLYYTAQYELGLAYMKDSQYAKTIQTYEQLLREDSMHRLDALLNIGSAYDYMDNPTEAKRYYDSVIKLFPHSNRPYYEQALLYFKQEDYEQAEAYAMTSFLMNPYHLRTLLVLAFTYQQQGRLSEAFLMNAFAMPLLNNEAEQQTFLRNLYLIANMSEEATKAFEQKTSAHAHPVFDEIDELIYAKLALSTPNNGLLKQDDILRTLHLIIEKLKYVKDDNNLVMQSMVPFFEQYKSLKMFHQVAHFLFDKYVENPSAYQAKNDDKVRTHYLEIINQIVSTRKLNLSERTIANANYIYASKDGILIEAKPKSWKFDEIFAGMTKVYRDGVKIAEGRMSDKGKREGAWTFYYKNGAVESIKNFVNGESVGEERNFWKNGQLKSTYVYNAKGVQVLSTEHTRTGILKSKQEINANNQLIHTEYHRNGQVGMEILFQGKNHDKEVDGQYTMYHENGQKKKTLTVRKQQIDGEVLTFYDKGQLESKVNYVNGKREGPFISYFENGSIDQKAIYKNDELHGLVEDYYQHTDRFYTQEMKGGKLHGNVIYYGSNKQPYQRNVFQDDKLMEIHVFENTPKTISITNNGKPLTKYIKYNEYGIVMENYSLNDNGEYHGPYMAYYFNGEKRYAYNYKNGKLDGKQQSFYKNGNLETEFYYVDGVQEGAYRSFEEDGLPRYKGWMLAGEANGVWKNYFTPDKVFVENFRVNGLYNGPEKTYYYNGKVKYINNFNADVLTGFQQLDTLGNVLVDLNFAHKDQEFYQLYPNKQRSIEGAVKHYHFDGKYISYYPDKTILNVQHYKYGLREGAYFSNNVFGTLSSKGTYVNNQLNGDYESYDEFGKLEQKTFYKDNEYHGLYEFYVNGALRYRSNYYKGNRHGAFTFHTDAAVITLFYDDDLLIGYATPTADGKFSEMIPIEAGTASITTHFSNGNKAATFNFKNSKYEGAQLLYYTNGQLAEERHFTNNLRDGAYRRFYANGQPLYVSFYKNGDAEGNSMVYNENGEKVLDVPYIQGFKHGTATFVSPEGKRKEIVYYWGEIMETK